MTGLRVRMRSVVSGSVVLVVFNVAIPCCRKEAPNNDLTGRQCQCQSTGDPSRLSKDKTNSVVPIPDRPPAAQLCTTRTYLLVVLHRLVVLHGRGIRLEEKRKKRLRPSFENIIVYVRWQPLNFKWHWRWRRLAAASSHDGTTSLSVHKPPLSRSS